MDYELIRTRRKTIAIYIRDARVIVRAPLRAPIREIDRFVASKQKWIEKHIAEQRRLAERREDFTLTDQQIRACKEQARRVIPVRAAHFSQLMGVNPAAIRIGSAKRSLGCCTAKGNLRFSWRLMLAEQSEIDYVVVHELAHLKQLNHSKAFWAIVAGVIPDYKERRKKLRSLQRLFG
jgi:predicted metal-dependent hydrolase